MVEYIRKWGGFFKEYGPCEPRPNIKYDIGLKGINCNSEILGIEPYFNNLQVDCDYVNYITKTQIDSKFDIASKFTKELSNDIVLEIDFSKVNRSSIEYLLSNIEDVLEQAESNTHYEVNEMLLKIKEKKQIQIKLRHD
jgi:hypothetical protein